MWSLVVEVGAPGRDQSVSMAQAIEQVLIQAFVALPAVEAFYKPVLHRLAGCDVVPVNLPVFLPFQDRIAGQFGSVVADHHAGIRERLTYELRQAWAGAKIAAYRASLAVASKAEKARVAIDVLRNKTRWTRADHRDHDRLKSLSCA